MRKYVCVPIAVCLLALLALLAPARSPAIPAAPVQVWQLRIDEEIEPILAEYMQQGIEHANEAHASLILITMNTPGGLGESMREIIQSILRSAVPVAVYVSPTGSRAASAGFFILLSADVAAMAPGTDTGAASPLLAIGGFPVQVDATLREKIVQETLAYLRSYASKRGRNVELAEKAVTEAKAFSEKEAQEGKLIDLVAASQQQLLAQLNGRTLTRFDGSTATLHLENFQVVPYEMSARQKLLSRIVQPDVFFVLLIVGVLGLYAEFTHPGMVAPGVVGAIAMVLALFAMHLLPINLAGLLLIVVAIALFILEAKYGGHGVLAIGGVIAMVLGAIMLIRTPLTGMGVSLGTALGVTIPFAVFVVLLMRLVLRSRRWKQTVGREQLIGELGEVTQTIDGTGMVFVHGELWRAVRATTNSSAAPSKIPRGARVRVVKVDGLTLQVEPLEMPAEARQSA